MASSFILNVIEDMMINEILSVNILEEMSLIYRISNSNVIHDVFKFIIKKLTMS